MAYKDGPIGGCTNLNSCDKISFTNIFACIYCEKSILDDSRSLKRISRTLHKIKQEQKLYDAQSPLRRQLELEIKEIYRELEKHNLLETMENLQ
ncbi:hypothetical protein WM94_15060 [Pseudomonas sp. ABFPK]|nr:hypothetical protein WM94_15060 [Pseudomonas sp. ABFPK]